MTVKRLAAIAQALRVEAQSGIARYRLKRGLALTLRRDNGDWVLSLSRDGKPPAEMEEQVCRRAFGLPAEGVERETADIQGWQMVRLRWRDEVARRGQQAQKALIGAAPATQENYYRQGG